MLIEGPAGIGKTNLLAEVRRLAADAGVRVLAARGAQLEQAFPFGIVRQLFEAVVVGDQKPLRGAAAAARQAVHPPVREASAAPGSADASFAILHALYWLTVNLAADGPLVLAIDDLHWCDEPSLRYLGYLVRRLEGLSATVIGTTRPLERLPQAGVLADIARDPLAVTLRPRPLSLDATALLVSELLDEEADARFAAACHTATGGSPLLLTELLKTLQADVVRPTADAVPVVAEVGPRAVSRAVLVRLARLSADAGRLARAAAVLGDGAEVQTVAELAGVPPDRAPALAAELVAAEILADQPDVAFVHPLVGAAVYEDIPAHEQPVVHEAAAKLLVQHGAPAAAVAAHLVSVPPRGQEWVCDVLGEAAQAALRAGSPTTAVAYLRRSLAEPPAAERRARVLLELGRAEAALDGPAAVAHLTEARELIDDREVREQMTWALAMTLLFTGHTDRSRQLIHEALSSPGLQSSDLRHRFQAAEVAATLFGTGAPVPTERFEQYRQLPLAEGLGARMLAAITARQLARSGGNAEECASLAMAALEDGQLIASDDLIFSTSAVSVLVYADREESVWAWTSLLEDAHQRGSLASKLAISLFRGNALLRRGELAEAESSLLEAREALAWNAGAVGGVHHAAFTCAVLRERGDLTGARRALTVIDDPGDTSDAARVWLNAKAELLLAEERYEHALTVAQDAQQRFAFVSNPIDTPFGLPAALALRHLGTADAALATAAEELTRARKWGAPGSVAGALRILGTVEGENGLDHLRSAVECADGSPAQLELAKALAALGRGLRAARRPTEAREPLRRALELAETLGATALAADARHELHAAGGRPRVKPLQGPDALTPAERRVTERAAAGQTNRAIAQALFVTPKTVELHLRNAYRKLGASSRHELTEKLNQA
jgi:DNA-binding CsgD family transcriptional regulator